jgi:hypothetical protein
MKPDKSRWLEAWPDALAFAGGLGLAWFLRWETRDLVWSLWLSSLVVGYAMIVWKIFGPAVFVGHRAWVDRAALAEHPKGPMALGGGLYLAGGLFLLAFFTVHFGMFHFVHSVFLQAFFPVEPGAERGFPGPALYWEVMQRYGWFLPAAFIAERAAFRFKPAVAGPPDVSVKAADIAARKARNAKKDGMDGMMAPYKNVVRMHLLIFFFAFVSFAKVENFWVYAVVYAVYFFPWRLLKKQEPELSADGAEGRG